ncbi:unnamed protein product [Protopolystoma xenopodis]|uniref:Uncharacterized protein n=1 Tax=Protopolystoma xenopodis TaxID=117903 RepID=A0A3S5B7B2_9PLAT|nr:unnamed protein product [Protopolystoma xenopodis]
MNTSPHTTIFHVFLKVFLLALRVWDKFHGVPQTTWHTYTRVNTYKHKRVHSQTGKVYCLPSKAKSSASNTVQLITYLQGKLTSGLRSRRKDPQSCGSCWPIHDATESLCDKHALSNFISASENRVTINFSVNKSNMPTLTSLPCLHSFALGPPSGQHLPACTSIYSTTAFLRLGHFTTHP